MSVAKSRRRCEAYAQAMRLPGRTDYALRAALELAASPDGPVTTDELSHRQDIPTSYLGAILAELRKAGIVHARRGAEGGWTLARAATEISLADVIDPTKLSGTVKFGATVKIVDEDTDEEKTYQIVGEYEADIENGRLNVKSPLARALIGKNEGDSIEVRTPGGDRGYEILKVSYS